MTVMKQSHYLLYSVHKNQYLSIFIWTDTEFLKNQYIYSGFHRLRYRILVSIRKISGSYNVFG